MILTNIIIISLLLLIAHLLNVGNFELRKIAESKTKSKNKK